MSITSDIKGSLALLPQNARRYLIGLAVLQIFLGGLDIIGVAISGLIGSLTATSYLHQSTPHFVTKITTMFHLSGQDPIKVITIFSFLALAFFVSKSVLAILLSKHTFRFLARQQAEISANATNSIFKTEYIWLRSQDPHELIMALDDGISAAIVITLGLVIQLISETALLALFFIFLIVINPLIAVASTIYLLIVSYFLYSLLAKRVGLIGQALATLTVSSRSMFFSSFGLFRELRVLGRTEWFEKKQTFIKKSMATSRADNVWVQQIPKYILEIALLLGISSLLFSARFFAKSENIIPILGIYMASAARIFPSLLRIQAAVLSLRSNASLNRRGFNLLDSLKRNQFHDRKYLSEDQLTDIDKTAQNIEGKDRGMKPLINVKGLAYRYPDAESFVFQNVTFSLQRGERIVIAGPSGSGKSTLCDLLLGLLQPTSGEIRIHERHAANWLASNVGRVAYLPQDTVLLDATLSDNVCLGLEPDEISVERLNAALSQAQILDFVTSLPQGLNTFMGAQGVKLSGGQRQRIGIARALYCNPEIIIMDEATSALDSETEHAFTSALTELDSSITIVMITHKLSTVRNAKRVLYLEDGALLADGTFDDVRHKVASFDRQARLLGL